MGNVATAGRRARRRARRGVEVTEALLAHAARQQRRAAKLAAFKLTYMELNKRLRPFVEVALRAAGDIFGG